MPRPRTSSMPRSAGGGAARSGPASAASATWSSATSRHPRSIRRSTRSDFPDPGGPSSSTASPSRATELAWSSIPVAITQATDLGRKPPAFQGHPRLRRNIGHATPDRIMSIHPDQADDPGRRRIASPRISAARRCCAWPRPISAWHLNRAEAGTAPGQRIVQAARRLQPHAFARVAASRRHRRLGRQPRRRGGLCRPRLGVPAEIFVPEITGPAKRARIEAYGARLVVGGEAYDAARQASEARAAETGALQIHAYDQAEVLAGQGTVGAGIRRGRAGPDPCAGGDRRRRADRRHGRMVCRQRCTGGERGAGGLPDAGRPRCARAARCRPRSAGWPPTAWARARSAR